MRKKKGQSWSPPAEWLAPVDPEQFKFCFSLMGAAGSGAMVTPKPNPILIEGIGVVSLKNTPFNRGMLAASKHLYDVYPHSADDEIPSQIQATMFRLTALWDFLRDCLQGKHPLSKRFIMSQGEDIHEALIEAAASAKINRRGDFSVESILSTAENLIATGRFVENRQSKPPVR